MHQTIAPLLLTGALLGASTAGRADDCRYTARRHAELDADGARSLTVEAAAGFLRIEGDAALDRVVVEGRACTYRERLLDDIELRTERRGDRLWVVAEIPESFGWHSSYAALDLTLRVPDSLALFIDDGSGDVELETVGAVDLDDGSGEIRIVGARGEIRIDDGSGDLRVENCQGDLRLDDGSGNIELRDIDGSVRIRDGSGEIEVLRVSRDVEVDDDGSGEIFVRTVDGSVTVDTDGSGGIEVEDVGGDFTVYHDGSGGIRYREVAGRVRLPRD